MNKESLKVYVFLIIGIIFLVILILTSLSYISTENLFKESDVILYIEEYLNRSLQISRQNLIILLELEALISPIKHSEAGVSFIVDIQVGVGNILTSFNTVINDSIKFYIFGISILELIKYIILFTQSLTKLLLFGLLFIGVIFGLCYGFLYYNAKYYELCNKVIKIFLILFIILHIVLPYSFYATAKLSKSFLHKQKIENKIALHNLHTQMKAVHIKQSIHKRAEQSIHSFEKIILDLPHKVELIIIHHTKNMAMTIFEYIILPVVLLVLFTNILRFLFKQTI